ncbi:MAG: alpha/beta hydrolase [Mycobacteriaceae bacterium]
MTVNWVPDILGEQYEQHTINLGADPDAEGDICATLVRHRPTLANKAPSKPTRAVLYVHGFTDYFFQTELAEYFSNRGYSFYALDLRKCGRSLQDGHTPHFVSNLAFYDAELNAALEIIRNETASSDVLVGAHSTGGIILPLWLDRLNRKSGDRSTLGIGGLFLNSPWFDLQGSALRRGPGTLAINAIAQFASKTVIKLPASDAYGIGLHSGALGAWDYNLEWKPHGGFPVTFGWLSAVRQGHAQLHRGLNVGVPSVVFHSDKTYWTAKYNPKVDTADVVLDVKQIARWSGYLGNHTSIVPIKDARHDIFLSEDYVRERVYHELGQWLNWRESLKAPASNSTKNS